MAFDWGNAFKGGETGAAAGSSFGPWGTAIGGTLGALGGGFFGDDEEHKTNQLLNQIPDQLKQYLMPYLNAGTGALGRVGTEYGNLLSNPNDIISRIGSGYKKSPGYQWRLGQGEQAITNAEAAGGMAGTAEHQQRAGELAENLANQDYWDYVGKGLNLYGSGLKGEQNLSNMGQASASDLSLGLANLLKGKAGLNYTRAANRNQANSDLMSSLLAYFGKKNNSFGSDSGDDWDKERESFFD